MAVEPDGQVVVGTTADLYRLGPRRDDLGVGIPHSLLHRGDRLVQVRLAKPVTRMMPGPLDAATTLADIGRLQIHSRLDLGLGRQHQLETRRAGSIKRAQQVPVDDEPHLGHHAHLLADSLQLVRRGSHLPGIAGGTKRLAVLGNRLGSPTRLLRPIATRQGRGHRIVAELGIVEQTGDQPLGGARFESLNQVQGQSPGPTPSPGIGDVGLQQRDGELGNRIPSQLAAGDRLVDGPVPVGRHDVVGVHRLQQSRQQFESAA